MIESDEQVMAFPLVDFWDWKMMRGTKKNGKGEVARLVGRLVRRSMKLHPSMPSGSGLLKTAPICEAHLDLVRVTSGLPYFLFYLALFINLDLLSFLFFNISLHICREIYNSLIESRSTCFIIYSGNIHYKS